MHIEESGADLTVSVDGQEYHAAASADFDTDGLDDTAVVETDDGSIAFTDTDSDGQADLMTQLDADGGIVGQARFDVDTGEWVHMADPRPPGAGRIMVDTGYGPVEVGAATHDTDGDGRDDTVVVEDSNGDIVIYSDADGDGSADVSTQITGEGHVTIAEHTSADGDWTVVERGHIDEHGEYHRDPLGADARDAVAEESGWITGGRPAADEVRIDPRTGNWVRG